MPRDGCPVLGEEEEAVEVESEEEKIEEGEQAEGVGPKDWETPEQAAEEWAEDTDVRRSSKPLSPRLCIPLWTAAEEVREVEGPEELVGWGRSLL